MASEKAKPIDVATNFRALSSIASSLNKASNELTQSVSVLDAALKKLNIGLTVWTAFEFWAVEEPNYGEDQIGYAKISGQWGIALRKIWGNESFDAPNEDGPWLFGEAPRELRIAAADHLPKLVEALGKQAFDTAKKLDAKTKEVAALAAVIDKIAKEEEGDGTRVVK
jgi:hypothetical protein